MKKSPSVLEAVGIVIGAVGLFLILACVFGLIGGAVVFALWNLFHLQDIVHLSYWQAIGVYFIFYAPAFSAATGMYRVTQSKK